MCAAAINDWLRDKIATKTKAIEARVDIDSPRIVMLAEPVALLVLDECDKDVKFTLKNTFRLMRRRLRPTSNGWEKGRLSHLHDDMYFGDSVDSVGIQVADICNYIMLRKLRDGIEDQFYELLLQSQVICAKPEPEWTPHKHLFRTHE
jgi:hypothetical protein